MFRRFPIAMRLLPTSNIRVYQLGKYVCARISEIRANELMLLHLFTISYIFETNRTSQFLKCLFRRIIIRLCPAVVNGI